MKRVGWSAVLVALVLMVSWVGAAQAQTLSVQSTDQVAASTDSTAETAPTESTEPSESTEPTETSEPSESTEPTETSEPSETSEPTETSQPTETTQPTESTLPAGEELCTPQEGLTSHSDISTDTASAHPTASASFTVKEGCRVLVFLASVDGDGNLVDIEPPLEAEDASFGPGQHTLTVDLPTCSDFFVLFAAVKLPAGAEAPAAPEQLAEAQVATAEAMSSGDQPEPEVVTLDEAEGTTTNCPAKPLVPVVPEEQLPDTGSNPLPMLIAALVLLVGGAGCLLAARVRGRPADR